MNEILNQTIVNVKLTNDKEFLTFYTHTHWFEYYADGDCCSTSWIEHMDDFIYPFTVSEVEEKNITVIQECGFDLKTDTYNDEIKQYFYELKTDKGSFTIEMRNESNGYYGGGLEFLKSGENNQCSTSY